MKSKSSQSSVSDSSNKFDGGGDKSVSEETKIDFEKKEIEEKLIQQGVIIAVCDSIYDYAAGILPKFILGNQEDSKLKFAMAFIV